jgi:hypothetical protein
MRDRVPELLSEEREFMQKKKKKDKIVLAHK